MMLADKIYQVKYIYMNTQSHPVAMVNSHCNLQQDKTVDQITAIALFRTFSLNNHLGMIILI